MALPAIRLTDLEAQLLIEAFPRNQCDLFWGEEQSPKPQPPIQKISERFRGIIKEFALDAAIGAGECLKRHASGMSASSLLITNFPLGVHPYSIACLASYLHSGLDHIESEGDPIMRVENQGQPGLGSSKNAQPIPWHSENAYASFNERLETISALIACAIQTGSKDVQALQM